MAENQQKQNATQGQNQKPAPKSEFQDIPEAVSSQRINMGIVSPMAPSGAEITRQKRESGDGEFGRIIGKTKEGAQALNEKTPVQNKPTATESTPTPDVFRAAPRKMPEMSFHQDIDQKKKEEVISEKQKQVKTESDQIEKEPIAEEGAVEIDKEGEESKSFLEMIGLAQDEKEGEDAGKTDEGAEDEDMTGVSRMGNGEENDRKNTKFDESNLMATGNKSQWLTMKEKIVVRDEKPSDEERQGITVEKPMFSESEQAHAEAQGLSGLIRKIQKKWNKHILENAAKTGVINIEPGEKMKGLSPEQQLKQAAQASAERDAEIRRLREAQKIYEKGLATIKDLIAPSSMVIEYDHLQISGKYAQSFFLYAYPRYLEVNWLSEVVNSDITMDISMFIYPIDSAGILKQLRNKSAQLSSSISINQEKGNVRDPQLETALADVEDLRDRLMRSEEKFFQFGLYFMIYADTREDLVKASKQIESSLGGKLIFTKRADMRMEQGLNSCLPQATDELGAVQNMNTGPLSTSFPFVSNELSDDHGILYGLNRHNDTLIIFDRFSLENANSVVLATSGAGKSYAVKLEILRSLMLATDVIVIDPENEYESLCNAVGGSYLRVSMSSDQRINPFDLPKPFAGEDDEPGKLLRQNVVTITGLLHIMLGKMTANEDAILDQALLDTYALKGITMDTPNPGEKEPPVLSDLYDVLMSMKGGEELATRLSKYTVGSFGGVFNHQTNVDMGRGMIVFCIRDLDDELRPMAMFVILNFIWGLVRSELRKRIMVIDEAWTMMQHGDSAKFVAGLTRRARKYFLGLTTITQNVHDFLSSDEGRTIITNSAMQMLLKQSPAAIDQMAEVFHLTEGEKYTLLNSDKGQGIFFAGMQHVAIQIIASYGEDQLMTTNPEEVLEQQRKDALEKQVEETE